MPVGVSPRACSGLRAARAPGEARPPPAGRLWQAPWGSRRWNSATAAWTARTSERRSSRTKRSWTRPTNSSRSSSRTGSPSSVRSRVSVPGRAQRGRSPGRGGGRRARSASRRCLGARAPGGCPFPGAPRDRLVHDACARGGKKDT